MIVLEFATRDHTIRDLSSLVMLVLFVSIPVLFIAAVVMLFVRFCRFATPASGLASRHLFSPATVALVHGIYIVGFLFSPPVPWFTFSLGP